MNKIKLTLQNGHMNASGGQTGTGGELELIQKVYYAIKTIIDSQYSDKIELSYDDATVKNGKLADYFIALHFDGSTNPNYNGGLVDAGTLPSATKDQDWAFATKVADYYFNPMGIRFAQEHRTINTNQYYAFNDTGENTKQFLIELGTLTNADDKVKCQDFNKIAKLLVEGMVAYFKSKEAIFSAPSTPTPPVADTTKIDGFHKQLQEQKKLVENLTNEKKTLAINLGNCQKALLTLQDRLDKIKVIVNT